MDETGRERRQFTRADFAHPIRFKLFDRQNAALPVAGCLADLSLGGARIELDDPYGHLAFTAKPGTRGKLEIALVDADPLRLTCEVRWAVAQAHTRHRARRIAIGVEFKLVEDWQLEGIRAFMSAKHTDHTMFWQLWDSLAADTRPRQGRA
jgi:c-di-GMP-binding flagellar brake protein YcgR